MLTGAGDPMGENDVAPARVPVSHCHEPEKIEELNTLQGNILVERRTSAYRRLKSHSPVMAGPVA